MRISGTVLSWKHSVACIRFGRVNKLSFWPKWAEERCFFPARERPWMDPKTPYWVQTYKFHSWTVSDTKDFHWSKAACYLWRFSVLQSKTFPYCEIIFELLDDPSARSSVKKDLQVSKFNLPNLLTGPLWWGQPHSRRRNEYSSQFPVKSSDLLSLCWPAGLLYQSSLFSVLSICWDWPLQHFSSHHAEDKTVCGLPSDTVDSLNVLWWTQESDLKLAKSLRPPDERYFAIQIALT